MALICTGECCHVVAKNTFWDLEDDDAMEAMEDIMVQRPRAMTDSALLRSNYFDDPTTDDDGTCVHDGTFSSVETDTGSSVDESRSPSPLLWSESDEDETSSHPVTSSVGESHSRPLWSDCDVEEPLTGGPPPGTFCQVPSLQWIPVAVPLPGKSCFAEADVKGCRTEPKPRQSKVSHNSEPTKAKQTVLRALKKVRQTVNATQ